MPEIVGTQTLVKARVEGQSLLMPLKGEVDTLSIKDAADYAVADNLLGRIMSARKIWLAKVNPIIEPIRAGLQLLYDLRNDFDKPLADYEANVKGKMHAFKLEERRQIQAAEAKRLDDIRRANEEAAAKERQATLAKTKQMKAKLMQQAAEAKQSAANQAAVGPAEEVKADQSSVRTKRVARVTDMSKFLAAVATGEIPDSLIIIDQTELNTAYKLEPEMVRAWPGVTVADEIVIAGKRSV